MSESRNPPTGDAAAHEYRGTGLGWPPCHFQIGNNPIQFCGQPKDAAIHRAKPDYIVTVAPEGVSVRKPEDRAETPAEPERCDTDFRDNALVRTCTLEKGHQGLHHDRTTPEASAPPERIWTVGGTHGHFFEREGNFATTEYVLHSTHDKVKLDLSLTAGQLEAAQRQIDTHDAEVKKLREALREAGKEKTIINTSIKRRCWCHTDAYCFSEVQCAAARAAVGEGK